MTASFSPPPSEVPAKVGLARTVGTVFKKEARDHLRDRRSVLGALLLPLLAPAMLVLGVRVHSHFREEEDRALPVVGAAHAPSLVDAITANGIRTTTLDTPPEEAVTNGEVLAVLVISDAYQERLASGKPAPLRLVFDSSKPKSAAFVRRVEMAIGRHAQTLASLRLIARGVSPSLAQPVRIRPIDVATPEQIAAQLLTAIPIMLMLAAVAGGMNIAIDTTAGERERRSLEPLLLNPAPRLGMVIGKWLTTALAGVLVCGVATVGFLVVHPELPLDELGLRVRFRVADAAMMIVWVAPLAAVAAALQMLIAGLAKTFKEAQTYLSVFILLPTLPAFFLMFSPMPNTWWACFVPALAQVTAILDILRGNPIVWWHVAVTWATSLLYTMLTLVVLERLLRREQTIFGR